MTSRARRTAVFATPLALLAASGCGGTASAPETSVFLTVVNGPGLKVPDFVRLDAADQNGPVWQNRRLPESGMAMTDKAGVLGSVTLFPGDGANVLDVTVVGLGNGVRLSEGTGHADLITGKQLALRIVLAAPGGDGGADAASDGTDEAGPSGDGGGPDAAGDASEAAETLDAPATDGPDAPAVDAPTSSPNGAACGGPAECASGFCTDGVCCETACSGPCQSCGLTGTLGLCAPAATGTDPRGDCDVEPASGCGHDGWCDGAGGCRKYQVGSPCAPATCSAGARTLARTCDGAGTCRPSPSFSCAPYQCGPGADCLTTCGGPGDCVSPATCSASSCGAKPLGAGCGGAGECNSGFCTDGVCCDSACPGACHACNLVGLAGLCSLVPAGADPDGDCPDDGVATCGRDGTCDGAGACRKYGAGATCVAGSCTGSTRTLPRTCDGAGTCTSAASTTCFPYRCDAGGTSCRSSCSDSTECAVPATCGGSVCSVPPGTKGCTIKGSTPGGGCATDGDCPLPTTGWCLGARMQGKTCTTDADCVATPANACDSDLECPDQLCTESAVACKDGSRDCHVKACTDKSTPAATDFVLPLHQCETDGQCTALGLGLSFCRTYGPAALDTQCSCIGYNCISTRVANTCSAAVCSNVYKNRLQRCIFTDNRCSATPAACTSGCCGACIAQKTPCQTDDHCDAACRNDADCPAGVCRYDTSITCAADADCTIGVCRSDVTMVLPKVGGTSVVQGCGTDMQCAAIFGTPPPGDGTTWKCLVATSSPCLSLGNRCVLGRCLDPATRSCMRRSAPTCGG